MLKNSCTCFIIAVLLLLSGDVFCGTKAFSLIDVDNSMKRDTNISDLKFDSLKIGEIYAVGMKQKKQYIGKLVNRDSISIILLTRDGNIKLMNSDIKIYKKISGEDYSLSRIINNNEDLTESYLSRISLGGGLVFFSHYGEGFSGFLFTLDVNISLRSELKYLFLNVGFNSYSDSYQFTRISSPKSIYVIPTFGINLYKGKITVFAGAGAYFWGLFNNILDGAPPVGYTFSLKIEYNIHKNISFGYQVQKPVFTGESGLNGLFLNNFYFSAKF